MMSQSDRSGQQLGNYRLIRLLGQGGFAEVYLGEHLRLKTQAAIKILSTHMSGGEGDYFQREAQTIAQLVHPHIVRVLDFDVQNGTAFLVQEYAPSGSLRDRHARGERVPLQTVRTYVEQITDALQFAHDQKLIHRDVKPENLLIGKRGEILLSDFGVATIAHSTGSMKTSDMAGTWPYMSPEQIQGKPRPSTDQYALAIIVYEWLAGERPFQGTASEIAMQHMTAPPPPMREKMANIPHPVEQIVAKALAKEPKERFPTIREFGIALGEAIQQAQQAQNAPTVLQAPPRPEPPASQQARHTPPQERAVFPAQKPPETPRPVQGPPPHTPVRQPLPPQSAPMAAEQVKTPPARLPREPQPLKEPSMMPPIYTPERHPAPQAHRQGQKIASTPVPQVAHGFERQQQRARLWPWGLGIGLFFGLAAYYISLSVHVPILLMLIVFLVLLLITAFMVGRSTGQRTTIAQGWWAGFGAGTLSVGVIWFLEVLQFVQFRTRDPYSNYSFTEAFLRGIQENASTILSLLLVVAILTGASWALGVRTQKNRA